MVSLLYAVAAFTCALVVLLLPARTRSSLSRSNRIDHAFLVLTDWTVIFCLLDAMWGVAASEVIINDTFLTIASTIFHLTAALTPVVWLYFVITYLGNVRHKRLYFGVSYGLFVGELVLLCLNFSNGCVFYIDAEGAYHSGNLRYLLFYAQYFTYVTIAFITIFRITWDAGRRSKHVAVLLFVSAPLLFGFFQQLFPDAPAYSLGYMLGCCIIYSFVVTEMLEERMKEALQMSSANRAKTAFLNSMSHDIRTPLNAITGFNNMALKELGKNDEKVHDCLEKIGRASDNLLSIINDILEISRIEAGKFTIAEDKGDVTYTFANIDSMMTEVAQIAGIELKFSVGNVEDRFVVCDFDHCARVFINIISNAIKYTGRGGHVDVNCSQVGRRDDGYAIYQYTFTDDGIGMSEEFQKQLFTPFSRESTSTVSKIQGTGLGLALSKDLVEAMGGTISCVSRRGEGSTFTVTLPFKIQEGQEFTDPFAEAEQTSRSLDGKRILLVEDNELNREIATAVLAEMGAEIESAEDGTDAVEMMKAPDAGRFDVILMDVQMPVLNGYDATRQIRALGTVASRIPIIAMTANAYDEDRRQALAAGMNAHVAKPIDVTAIQNTISEVLRMNF